MRSTSATLAFSPAIARAGSPGMSRNARNTSVAAPSRTGMVCANRRKMYVLTCGERTSGERHVVEVVNIRWLLHKSLDALADRGLLLHASDKQPGRVVDDALFGLVEQVFAFGDVCLLVGLIQQVVDLGYRVPGRVRRRQVGAVEEHAEEVLGVPSVRLPTIEVHGELVRATIGAELRPFFGLDLTVDADVLPVLLNRFGQFAALRVVRARNRIRPD